ncbi:syntaxin-16-like isoform X1 [Saccoglossus kowalevskii]|uniref:Syntaxin-16-like isoform X1 n=1 Tax=Saccoglossus kowalevskii TaxID=10224 RepID=A0ABM0GQH8_SACKO|nr:PREDICTED: syntaxin-16-like isoform X1 [Saccoglossus kowalevskii]
MATRSLTEVFILMRNNAMQNRHIFSEQVADDRMALVSSVTTDPEAGIGVTKGLGLPPDWVDLLEEIQYDITRIKQKMKELSSLHDKYLNRPTLDDNVDEEHAIEITTQETTQMFHRCQRNIQQIGLKSRMATPQERKVTKNIMSSLAASLQDLSINFRRGQSAYLKRMKSREERAKQFFDTGMSPGSSLMAEENLIDDELYDKGFSEGHIQMVAENTALVEERDKAIQHIVQSISDLNEVFRDLATMVVEQGTILDRIDYNIEKTTTTVQQGMKQLQKAEKYQKKNKKMLFIMVLAVIIIILIVILIAMKT